MKNRFNPFPTLTTGRLTLRQLSIDDKDAIFALRSDPEINKFLGRAPSKNIDDAINFINNINDNIKQNNSIYWVITLRETNTFVGTICLFDFSIEKNTCEIGYELITKFQGKGIMKEAIQVVIEHAFQKLTVQKIIACTHIGNQGSTKLLRNCNFIESKDIYEGNADFIIFTLTVNA